MGQQFKNTAGHPLYTALLPIGGLLLGFGLVSLYYSFGWEGGPLNQDLAGVGFTGLDNIGRLGAADYSIGMVVAGVITMVFLNAGAWRKTDGY
jgi:hypothetical protein